MSCLFDRSIILSALTRNLFRKRSIARRREELGLEAGMRKVWMLIDEAHQFVPAGKSTLCKEALIQWVKEGRQPGLSLVVASQQPAALDMEVEALATVHQLMRPAGLHQRAWELTRHFDLPAAYDAHYLALAEMVGCPFWTADERLFNVVCGSLDWVDWLGDYQTTLPR